MILFNGEFIFPFFHAVTMKIHLIANSRLLLKTIFTVE